MRFWKRRQRLLQVRRLFLACGYKTVLEALLEKFERAKHYEATQDIYDTGPHFVN